jgi:glycosyltransferase involved in cell wall biosynthesis
MATGWFGVDVPQALLNIHYFDVIDWAARENPTVADRKGLWQARRATKHLLQSVQNVRLLTPRLKQMAQSIYSQGRYSVVPLALYPALYPFQPLVEEPVVGLIGSMNWGPSRSAALRLMTRIWPLIRRSHPTARLLIAGWNARKYLAPHLPSSGVTLADDIADPVEFFSKAAVMVYAPSRGSGMKVKVMEAMAFGVPVVTTWEGMEGFDYQDGTHCWVGETDEKLAEKTTRLLSSLEERRLMRLAARSLIEEKYSPRPIVDQMMNVYEGMNTVTPRTAEESICI